MDKSKLKNMLQELKTPDKMYHNDFLLTWEKNDDEIAAVIKTAKIFKSMHTNNISIRIFDSGFRIRFVASRPSISGIWISMSIRS